MLVGGPLEPAALVQSVSASRTFPGGSHPCGRRRRLLSDRLLFIARSAQRSSARTAPDPDALGLRDRPWIFALYVMAHLIAGLPAFLGFIPLTWVSLAGHLLFGVVVAFVVDWRESGK